MSIVDISDLPFMRPAPIPKTPLAQALEDGWQPGSPLSFDDMTLGYALLSGKDAEAARTELVEMFRPMMTRALAEMKALLSSFGQDIVCGIAAGIRPGVRFHARPPRRANRRAHGRKVKRG